MPLFAPVCVNKGRGIHLPDGASTVTTGAWQANPYHQTRERGQKGSEKSHMLRERVFLCYFSTSEAIYKLGMLSVDVPHRSNWYLEAHFVASRARVRFNIIS